MFAFSSCQIFFSSYLRFMTNFAVLVLLDTYNCLFSFSPSDHHAGASESEKREAENKFKEVGEAYEVLSDTKQKSRYDN